MSHHYQPDTEITDHRGRHPCTCGMPEQWRGHQVPDTDPDQRAAELRRVGERDED